MKKTLCLLLSLVLISGSLVIWLGDTDEVQASSVSLSVAANEKITLTMDDAVLNFGNMDPGTTVTSATTVTGNVKSNKTWNLTYTASGMDTNDMALSNLKWGTGSPGTNSFSTSGTFLSNQRKTAGQGFTHYYTLEIPWTADPGAYSASAVYSATQTAP